MRKIFKTRFSLLLSVILLYVVLCFISRTILLFLSFDNLSGSFIEYIRLFVLGFIFDFCTAHFFVFFYSLYLLVFPAKWIGSIADKIITYTFLSILLLIIFFSLIAEYPFWSEFGVRYNFIAVDYLVYTYEVVENINESYPLALIILLLLLLIFITILFFKKTKVFSHTFSAKQNILQRVKYSIPVLVIAIISLLYLKNQHAEFSKNLTINELSKNGTFSFFAAYRSNELDYETFYPNLPEKDAYTILKKRLLQDNQTYNSGEQDNILRFTKGSDEKHPNIVLIAIESFSAEYLSAFGNKKNITPNYDSLAEKSIFFKNLYATGTRTVRGMEALVLSVPPTPGNSIVRRPGNQHLFSIATILKERNYHPYFIYGGDGYFDNMNNFFGGQGFDIVDRDRGNPLSDDIETKRFRIPSGEVTFENAWGICDEDLYKQALKYGDSSSKENKPFFQFIMTTSNHKPYTFPEGKINLKQGERDAAVKYTDYALGKFIAAAKSKSWFKNTVFVIVADHCASSAGKWEINIDKHHIPAIIYNLDQDPGKINRLVSQVDLMPTLFGYLGWNYNSALYGKDINQVKAGDERAFIGNYRTLGLLRGDLFTQLDERKRIKQFAVSDSGKSMRELKTQDKNLADETISYYQTASERFKNGKMKTGN